MKLTAWILLALFPFFTLLSGCNRGQTNGGVKPTFGGRKLEVLYPHKGTMPIKATCTTGMVADVVGKIGGPLVQIERMMGEGSDPHTHTVTSADLGMMNRAEVIFYSGLHLEGKMIETLEREGKKKPVFPVTEYLSPSSILTDEHDHPDPHVWFDVARWSEVAQVIGNALALYDPTNAATYKKNTEAYRAELAKLHDEAKTKLATIPKENRALITSHDAFRYFGRAYDIEVKGIQGISTDTEASLREINELVDFIVARKVKAVFVESSVNERNMESLRQGCKSRGQPVALGGTLFSDAMGKDGTPEGTYIGMIRHNVETITKALK